MSEEVVGRENSMSNSGYSFETAMTFEAYYCYQADCFDAGYAALLDSARIST